MRLLDCLSCGFTYHSTQNWSFRRRFPKLVAWHSGRTSVSGRRTFPVLRSTCSWWVTTNVGKPSAIGQPTRPTQPFILSGSISWVVSWNQMCAAVYRQRLLVKATEVTVGLAESNGSLLPGIWRDSLHVTCGLTACTPGSAPGPTLGNEYGKTLPFPFPKPVCWRGMEKTKPNTTKACIHQSKEMYYNTKKLQPGVVAIYEFHPALK